MKKISKAEILKTISLNELKSWQTKTGIPFTCKNLENHIEITNSKENIRKVSHQKLDEFSEKFNETHSPKVSDYKDISFDASYLLTIINAILGGELFDSEPNYFSILDDAQKSLSRSKIYQQLGASLRNERWAWGGISDNQRYVIFTVWVDRINDDKKIELYNPLNEKNRNGAKEQKRLIDLAFNDGLHVYGLLCEAKDPASTTRSIKRVEQNDLIQLELERSGDIVLASLKNRFPMYLLSKKNDIKQLAINDLDQEDIVNDVPNKASTVVAFYQRDPKVRKKILQMADGKCEYCGVEGFLKPDSNRYLETHHIIALSNEGKDKITNVIALCPEHHKEAHFGVNSEKLEIRFLEIVQNRQVAM